MPTSLKLSEKESDTMHTAGKPRLGRRLNPFRQYLLDRNISELVQYLANLFPSAESHHQYMYRPNRCFCQRVDVPEPMSSMQYHKRIRDSVCHLNYNAIAIFRRSQDGRTKKHPFAFYECNANVGT